MKPLIATFLNSAACNIAIRLTLASMIAMSVATALGMESPWWAAMAVWMIGQPPRGLLFERSLAQLIGTLVGAVAGALLVIAGSGSSAVSLAGLAAWIAVCCGVANAMRHQRAYGAALCGLSSAVIVALTLGTTLDPSTFAAARVLDNLIGVVSAVGVAIALGPPTSGPAIAGRARTVATQALTLIADALTEDSGRPLTREREFLLSLAAVEASAEDAVAGSIAGRRRLGEMNALFAFLLDLIVVARAIRSREASSQAPGHAGLMALREAFDASANVLTAEGVLDVEAIDAASRQLEASDPVLSPVLGEMRMLLARTARVYRRFSEGKGESAPQASRPHPEIAGLRLAMLRGAIAASVAGLAWLAIDWEPMRYLLLGTCIFTVLFSMVDEPAPAVRQIFLGGLAAAIPAVIWRLVVVPEVGDAWLSLLLAVPFVFIASLLQSRPATLVIGLAFNMLFAVMARPVDTSVSTLPPIVANEALLLAGIVLNYALYRWLLPMNPARRRMHLRASIRREISAISIRAGTPWAERHLARLRYLVFSLAVRSRGQVQQVEDALAALTLGHALFRLGEMQTADLAPLARDAVRETLRLACAPLDDPHRAGVILRECARRLGQADPQGNRPDGEQTTRIRWLLGLAAREFSEHAAMFTATGNPGRPAG
ncbi:FUSC family protein [Verticiella sediminum]|uniref:FUSC family protein n=1 Tax=Verticiella sediminum TaxID=1247510 RepID=UPI001B88614B|nr:FUSC family protein [Verticiella sediminum]